jgi:hypothetical protein
MNLGPWKYRKILSSEGGPIRKIEVVCLTSPILKKVYEAYAELDPSVLSFSLVKDLKVYGTADGSGTALYQNLARYKSISEALERWAFYETAVATKTDRFGFAVDCSTSGMAAFPGLTYREASDNAFYEAIERWALCAWWEGKLPASGLPSSEFHSGIEINVSPLLGSLSISRGRSISVVVLWSKLSDQDRVCYGFSCASTLEKAIQRASVELDRNRRVLSELPPLSEVTEVGEKRLLFFSVSEGNERFMDQVNRSLSANSTISSPPKLVANEAIPGQWTRYCKVWRCLLEPISSEHSSAKIDYFLF